MRNDGVENAYEVMQERMQPMIEADSTNNDFVEIDGVCDYCLRPAETFGGEGVAWVNSYNSQDNICKTCSIFVEQLPSVLGFERQSIGYKLSSFKGGIIAIPKDKNLPVEMWVGGNYLKRVNHEGPFKIVDLTGNNAKYSLCETIGRYSVVTEISLRREMFMRHLKLSSKDTLNISTETGVVSLKKGEYQALKQALVSEQLGKKELENVIVLLNSLKTNRIGITDKRVQGMLSSVSADTRQAISNVVDPSSLLYMLAALKAGIAP